MRRSSLVLLLCLVLVAPLRADPPGNAWVDLGQGLAGSHGVPTLVGSGPFVARTTLRLSADGLEGASTAWWVVGFSALEAPFRGGVLVPEPDILFAVPTGGAAGAPASTGLEAQVPSGVPQGTELIVQCWVADPGGPQGLAATNALRGTAVQLYDHLSAEFDARLTAALPAAQSLAIYSQQDFGTQTYVRNPDGWAADLDLTGISPWNGTGGATRAGTLVSPRHIVFAEHFPISTAPGSNEIVFVTADDQVVTRQVTAVAYPGGDTAVGLLDSDVPPTITWYKVLPKVWHQYIWEQLRLPMLHLDQQEKALVRDLNFVSANSVLHLNAISALRAPFTETLIGGDSGNPGFLVIDGEPVLMLTHFTATSGPFYTKYLVEVSDAMTALGGGYELTKFDLAGWLEP